MLASCGYANRKDTAVYIERFHDDWDAGWLPTKARTSSKAIPLSLPRFVWPGKDSHATHREPTIPDNVFRRMRLADPGASSNSSNFKQGNRQGKADRTPGWGMKPYPIWGYPSCSPRLNRGFHGEHNHGYSRIREIEFPRIGKYSKIVESILSVHIIKVKTSKYVMPLNRVK